MQSSVPHITWSSSGNCGNRDNPTCTSFSGIKSGTISGTRPAPTAPTACVGNHIRRNFSYIGGNQWRSSAGNVYFNEGDHWDITYY